MTNLEMMRAAMEEPGREFGAPGSNVYRFDGSCFQVRVGDTWEQVEPWRSLFTDETRTWSFNNSAPSDPLQPIIDKFGCHKEQVRELVQALREEWKK